MTVGQIEELISRWIDPTLEEAEDYRAICGPVSDEYRESQLDGHLIELEAAQEALVSCNYRRVEKEADELLTAAGLPPRDHDGAQFGWLCRRLLLGKQEVSRTESERKDGVYSASKKPTRPVNTQSPTALPPQTKGKRFSEVLRLYCTENPRANRSEVQMRAELERFVVVIGGDKPVNTITKEDCRTYKQPS